MKCYNGKEIGRLHELHGGEKLVGKVFPDHFPVTFFWQEASIDSLVEESKPARLDDWSKMTTPARVMASNKVPMIVLFRMWCWFLSI